MATRLVVAQPHSGQKTRPALTSPGGPTQGAIQLLCRVAEILVPCTGTVATRRISLMPSWPAMPENLSPSMVRPRCHTSQRWMTSLPCPSQPGSFRHDQSKLSWVHGIQQANHDLPEAIVRNTTHSEGANSDGKSEGGLQSAMRRFYMFHISDFPLPASPILDPATKSSQKVLLSRQRACVLVAARQQKPNFKSQLQAAPVAIALPLTALCIEPD